LNTTPRKRRARAMVGGRRRWGLGSALGLAALLQLLTLRSGAANAGGKATGGVFDGLTVKTPEELGFPTSFPRVASRDGRREVEELRDRTTRWQKRILKTYQDMITLDSERVILRSQAKRVHDRFDDETRDVAASILSVTQPPPTMRGPVPGRIGSAAGPGPVPGAPVEEKNPAMMLMQAVMPIIEFGIGYLVRKLFVTWTARMRLARHSKSVLADAVQAKDVIGCDEAKEEVVEAVKAILDAGKAHSLGARPPAGVLLFGPPGTGKTLLASSVAREAGLPFFSISGSDCNRVYAGQGVEFVRRTFAQARQAALHSYFINSRRRGGRGAATPCAAVIHIDEIDAVGRKRSSSNTDSGYLRDSDSTLNQLLVEMDGVKSKIPQAQAQLKWWDVLLGRVRLPTPHILVLGSTNRPNMLDPALLRAGRFDRRINVPVPDRAGREALFEHYLARVKTNATSESVGAPSEAQERKRLASALAAGSPGFVGADVAAVVNEAALLATTANHTAVTEADLEAALDKVSYGRARARLLSPEAKWRVAVHEAGHAVAAWFSRDADPVRKVSVLPRGDFLGATFLVPGGEWAQGSGAGNETAAAPEEGKYDEVAPTVQKLEARMLLFLAGRAAEEVVLGDIGSGAEDDISKATQMALDMVYRSGRSRRLGPMAIGTGSSERTRQIADEECRKIVFGVDRKTKALMRRYETQVRLLAEKLVEKETLNYSDIEALLGPPTGATAPVPVMAPAPLTQLVEAA